jgi:hypothetical protein
MLDGPGGVLSAERECVRKLETRGLLKYVGCHIVGYKYMAGISLCWRINFRLAVVAYAEKVYSWMPHTFLSAQIFMKRHYLHLEHCEHSQGAM